MADWAPITASVADDGTNRCITVNPILGDYFYRLIKQ